MPIPNLLLRRLAACALLLTTATACGLPLSTRQGPVPLPPRTNSYSLGVAPVLADVLRGDWELLVFSPYANFRRGVSERVEVGASAGFLNGLTAEAKYNFVPGPVHVSGHLALSWGVRWLLLAERDGRGSDLPQWLGVHPALLVGTERVYGGAKLLTYPSVSLTRALPVLFAGGALGTNPQLVPDIAAAIDPRSGEMYWVLGLAARFRSPDRR